MKTKKKGTVSKGVRFPIALFRKLQYKAKEEGRSFSNTVVHIVHKSLTEVKKSKNKIICVIGLGLALLVSACTGSEGSDVSKLWNELPAQVTIEDDKDQEVIDLFNSMFSVPVFEESDSDSAIKIAIVDYEIEDVEDSSDSFLALTSWSSDSDGFYDVSIMIEDWVYDLPHYSNILAHELGHALGAPHMDTGIMSLPVGSGRTEEKIDDGLTQWIEENYGVERVE